MKQGWKFVALCWLAWRERKRGWFCLGIELGLVAACAVVLAVRAEEVQPEHKAPLPPTDLRQPLPARRLRFAPEASPFARSVMATVKELQPNIEYEAVRGPEDIYVKDDYQTIGVVFYTKEDENDIQYAIRSPFPHETDVLQSQVSEYVSTPFVRLQTALDLAIVRVLTGTAPTEEIFMQRFSAWKETSDARKNFLLEGVPNALCLAYLIPYVKLLKRISRKKESGMKLMMLMTGLRPLVMWGNSLLEGAVIGILISAVMTLVLWKYVMNCHPLMLFLSLFLYSISHASIVFFIAAVTTKSYMALILRSLLLTLTTTLGSLLTRNADTVPVGGKFITSIVPNFTILWLFNTIAHYEDEQPLGMNDLMKSPPGGLAVAVVWVVLVLQSLMYFGLAVYLDPILPGKFGVAASASWPCKSVRRLLAPAAGQPGEGDAPPETMAQARHREHHERAPLGASVGMSLRNVAKEYPLGRRRTLALAGVSLDMYRDHIAVLLGQNGAGKTTTISVLAGVIRPNAGHVYMEGQDAADGFMRLDGEVSLCPQDNLFMPYLTAWEHLLFFSMMAEAAAEVLGLPDHMHKLPHWLSGGYRRRLCLALALIGDPQVVLLDEPSSGLDAAARRDVWHLLQKLRSGRTIVVATHSMEEADVLGDRIAILSGGHVLCYGSSMYLRNMYGAGYRLTVHKALGARTDDITAEVLRGAPTSRLGSDTPGVSHYRIRDTAPLVRVAARLERNMDELRITGLDFTHNSIEDVFFRAYEKEGAALQESGRTSEKALPLNTGYDLLRAHHRAIFHKEIIYTARYWVFYLVTASFVLLVAVAAVLLSDHVRSKPRPARPMHLSMYGPTGVLFAQYPGADPALVAALRAAAAAQGAQVTRVTSVHDYMAERSRKYRRYEEVIAAAEVRRNSLTALYSPRAAHGPPVAVSLITNALLRRQPGYEDRSITTINQPLAERKQWRLFKDLASFLWDNTLKQAFVLWLTLSMLLHAEERLGGAKELQMLAGVPLDTYWLCRLCWHMALHVPLALSVVGLVAMLSSKYQDKITTWYMTVLFVSYGWSGLPFAAFLSFFARSRSGCFDVTMLIYLAEIIADVLLRTLGVSLDNEYYLSFFLCLSPPYALARGLLVFMEGRKEAQKCLNMLDDERSLECFKNPDDLCCTCHDCVRTDKNNWRLNIPLLYLCIVDGPLYSMLVFLLDSGIAGRVRALYLRAAGSDFAVRAPGLVDKGALDEEESAHTLYRRLLPCEAFERRLERGSQQAGVALLACGVVKRYRSAAAALKGVSLRVRSGECFGLLGLNGAGKTTAFRVLSAGTACEAGDSLAGYYRMRTNRYKYMTQLGYCMQQDTLVSSFSGQELARLMARLRGVPEPLLDREIDHWRSLLGLDASVSEKCGTYSGGTRRKLCALLALLGRPAVVLLDEPTAGVDPASRRKLWRALLTVRRSGRAVVLTSHSMDECEALCDRLGLLVEGHIRTTGAVPELKQRLARGCIIKVKTRPAAPRDDVVQLHQAILDRFGEQCRLHSQHMSMLEYHVLRTSVSSCFLFVSMHAIKEQYSAMEDFSVSKTSLEQIMLSIRRGGGQ